jgi:subtilisin family serine protease
MGIMVAGNTTDRLIGVAPGAQWISAKIFNDAGQSAYSTIHEAFQWILDPDGNPETADAPHVMNCSWDLAGSSGAGTVDPEFRADIQAQDRAAVVLSGNGANGQYLSQPADCRIARRHDRRTDLVICEAAGALGIR